MNFVRIHDCYIRGGLSPIRFSQSTTINPEVTEIGVDTISITDNIVENTTITCIELLDVSYSTLEIARN
jgi:hypothetical protein